MINLAISGAQGRMGQAITKMALADPAFKVTVLLEHKDHPKNRETLHGIKISTDNSVLKGCDALIEFTLPEGTMDNVKTAAKHKVPMVIGTTGFTAEQTEEIKKAAKIIPIVLSTNMSIGVNTLFKMIEIAATKIDPVHISLTETHHIHKKDKPSGTAKTMAETAEKFSKIKLANIESIREGEVIGDHSIRFESNEDVLTISHHAKDRGMFAKGALTAAKFLQSKKPGLYNMQDVLGFNS
ncbi:MAG: 4-hydroxy-tetrahydrodipicolinate reductase [Candidatus Omnitrophica bacterium]|nr:4-hydroxy-tetrahydrodipicolinate reductase [Candidatus Omnitrophota bacterium]